MRELSGNQIKETLNNLIFDNTSGLYEISNCEVRYFNDIKKIGKYKSMYIRNCLIRWFYEGIKNSDYIYYTFYEAIQIRQNMIDFHNPKIDIAYHGNKLKKILKKFAHRKSIDIVIDNFFKEITSYHGLFEVPDYDEEVGCDTEVFDEFVGNLESNNIGIYSFEMKSEIIDKVIRDEIDCPIQEKLDILKKIAENICYLNDVGMQVYTKPNVIYDESDEMYGIGMLYVSYSESMGISPIDDDMYEDVVLRIDEDIKLFEEKIKRIK